MFCTSVFEAVRGFEAASGRAVPYATHPRRAGDLATVVADPALGPGFRAHSDDTRESPAFDVAARLPGLGARGRLQ